jgi:hypothetical protein
VSAGDLRTSPDRKARDWRAIGRYLDRPSLPVALGVLVLLGLLLGLLIDKALRDPGPAGQAWDIGVPAGIALAVALTGGICLVWRAGARAARARAERSFTPGYGWAVSLLLIVAMITPFLAAFHLIGYKQYGDGGVQRPDTIFELAALSYASCVLAFAIVLGAWLPARPYYGMGFGRSSLRGTCPGPARVHLRPASTSGGGPNAACYLPTCACGWMGTHIRCTRPARGRRR